MVENYLIRNQGVKDESVGAVAQEPIERFVTSLHPFFSPKGEDNVFIKKNGIGGFTNEFGDDLDNIRKYGQLGANALQSLRGGSDIIAFRLMPTDAARATLVMSAVVETKQITLYERDEYGFFKLDGSGEKIPRLDGSGSPLTEEGVEVGFVFEPFENRNASLRISTSDGKTKYPIKYFKHSARGKCGDSYGVSFEVDTEYDEIARDGRRYILRRYELDVRGNVRELGNEYEYSYNPAAVFRNTPTSEYLSIVYQNIFNRQTPLESKNPVQLELIEENIEALLTRLAEFVPGDIWEIDFIGCRYKDGRPYDLIVSDGSYPSGSVVFMRDGSDGSLGLGNEVRNAEGETVIVDQAHIESVKTSLLVDFFNCNLNDDIFNSTLVDANIIYDGNMPMAAKQAMVSTFRKLRQNIKVIADCGITNTPEEAINIYSSIANHIDGELGLGVDIVGPGCETREAGKVPQDVTYTYELARRIPENYRVYGMFTAPSGWEAGQVKYVYLKWIGRTGRDMIAKRLRDRGIWFVQRINDRHVQMIEENQYLLDDEFASKMKHFRFSSVVLEGMLNVEKIISKYPYDYRAKDVSIEKAHDECLKFFGGRYPEGIRMEVVLYQTKRDEDQERASADIIFYLPGFIRGFTVKVISRRG